MGRQHADNWSHPSHYLVDPYTWPWSPNGHDHGHEWPTVTSFVQCQSALQFWDTTISKFDHGQGHLCGQRSRSHLTFKIQRSRLWSSSNPFVTFEAWSSIDIFAFRFEVIWPFFGWDIANSIFDLENWRSRSWPKSNPMAHLSPRVQSICLLFVSWQSDHFWLRYSKLCIWPWKVKVMAKVKPDGHIWALEFNRYVCFSFRGNGTIFGWDIANSIFDLEKSRSKSWRNSKSNQVIYSSGPTVVPEMKETQKVVQKLSREQESAAGGGGVRTGTKTSSHPQYTGVT